MVDKHALVTFIDQKTSRLTARILYHHQLALPELHSQLLNYGGPNRYGTGRWFSLTSTELTVYHQSFEYITIGEREGRLRSYKLEAYPISRTAETEDFIKNLAWADPTFGMQLEQMGTPLGGPAAREEYLLGIVADRWPRFFGHWLAGKTRPGVVKAHDGKACFVRYQKGIYLGLGIGPVCPEGQTGPGEHGSRLVVGFEYDFDCSGVPATPCQREAGEFFSHYRINAIPGFALSLPLRQEHYQLWRQVLPGWFSHLPTGRFAFHLPQLELELVADNAAKIVQQACLHNHSLDSITHTPSVHLLSRQEHPFETPSGKTAKSAQAASPAGPASGKTASRYDTPRTGSGPASFQAGGYTGTFHQGAVRDLYWSDGLLQQGVYYDPAPALSAYQRFVTAHG